MNDITTEMEGNVKRLSLYRIVEHWLFAAVFLILVITGLSQRFYNLDLSQWFILSLGGIDSTRLIHRYTGTAFLLLSIIHILIALIGLLFKGWQPSMIITKKDFTDAVHDIEFYIGISDYPCACSRYSYKQKFEYWSILISAIVMSITGLILWFPVFITRLLPGELIPAAKVLHSQHALLILIITVIWHIYNSIFSPEVFPVDKSIFTGYISRERMLREHPLELSSNGNTIKPVDEGEQQNWSDLDRITEKGKELLS